MDIDFVCIVGEKVYLHTKGVTACYTLAEYENLTTSLIVTTEED